jgi:DNA-binding response OmpR family regulator
MSLIRILYIEDDLTTAKYLTEFLQEYGFDVVHTDTITSALSFLNQIEFDLILLDLNLPDFDGFELLKSENFTTLPIIVISALNDTNTKVKAFRYGASDYMVKPIDLLELEARIWSHLKKYGKIEKIKDNSEVFYIKNNHAYFQDKIIDFTPVELDIFKILLKNKNQTISRERLTDALSSISSHRTLDYHMKNIRTKINDNSKTPKYLKTEYGVGYKLILS